MSMRKEPPKLISDAIANGVWRTPRLGTLRSLVGHGLELPDLELFEEIDTMQRVSDQLNASGYVEDSEFCMRRTAGFGTEDLDPRLVFEDALFIAGSAVPGDDVFVAADLRSDSEDPEILVFDWNRPVPQRWIVVGTLSELIEMLGRIGDPR
jgi:hypothetical protein